MSHKLAEALEERQTMLLVTDYFATQPASSRHTPANPGPETGRTGEEVGSIRPGKGPRHVPVCLAVSQCSLAFQAVIRVHFPDKWVLQGCFRPRESCE